jgi:hypothetical protein
MTPSHDTSLFLQLGWISVMEAVSVANVAAEALVSQVAIPFAVLGSFFFVLIIPALREKSLWAHFLKHSRTLNGHVQFLLAGGWRFVLAYLSGWTFIVWAFALYMGFVGDFFFGEDTVASLVIGVMTFVGQVLIVSACLVYPSPKREPSEPKTFMIKDTVLFKAFAAMTVGLAIIGATLAGLVVLQQLDTSYNFQKDAAHTSGNVTYTGGQEGSLSTKYHSQHHLSTLSALCCLLSVVLTHGILGRWHHEDSGKNWSFFQPFVGGFSFVAAQILSWVCVAACIGIVFEKALRFFMPEVGLVSELDTSSDTFLSLSAGVTGIIAEVRVSLAYSAVILHSIQPCLTVPPSKFRSQNILAPHENNQLTQEHPTPTPTSLELPGIHDCIHHHVRRAGRAGRHV